LLDDAVREDRVAPAASAIPGAAMTMASAAAKRTPGTRQRMLGRTVIMGYVISKSLRVSAF